MHAHDVLLVLVSPYRMLVYNYVNVQRLSGYSHHPQLNEMYYIFYEYHTSHLVFPTGVVQICTIQCKIINTHIARMIAYTSISRCPSHLRFEIGNSDRVQTLDAQNLNGSETFLSNQMLPFVHYVHSHDIYTHALSSSRRLNAYLGRANNAINILFKSKTG